MGLSNQQWYVHAHVYAQLIYLTTLQDLGFLKRGVNLNYYLTDDAYSAQTINE